MSQRRLTTVALHAGVDDLPQRAYAKIRQPTDLPRAAPPYPAAVTPAQSVVLHEGDTVLGRGMINWVGDMETTPHLVR